MSIRTNPMKAVPTLLKRLVTVGKDANMIELEVLKYLRDELIAIEDLFSKVKKNEDELLDTLTQVDGYLRNKNIRKLMEERDHIFLKIRSSTKKLLPARSIDGPQSIVRTDVKFPWEKKEEVCGPLGITSHQVRDLILTYYKLDDHAKRCFSSLLLFPNNAILKERNVLLWWTHAVDSLRIPWQQTGESVFRNLLYCGLIEPYGYSKCPVEKNFHFPLAHRKLMRPLFQNNEKKLYGIYSQIITSSNPSDSDSQYEWVSDDEFGLKSNPSDSQYECLVLDQRKVKLSDDEFGLKSSNWKAIFNVGANYLNFEPQWLARRKRLEVLQLGRWLHGSQKHHIEVKSEEFLKELRRQKNLKYLSLRGVSGISNLPPILKLERLETLDLKACHNLETLPNDISSLRKLRHLNLSECYLLDKMPRGIEKLTKLQVLRGFVIGSSGKTSCKISDLAKLKKLERLSIYIGSKAKIKEGEFESLEEMSALEGLKISWGTTEKGCCDIEINFPSNLKKFHVKGFPGESIPEWLKPDKLPWVLNELYITGGKLRFIDLPQYVDNLPFLQIIHLKYLGFDPFLKDLHTRKGYLSLMDHNNLRWSSELLEP